MYFINEFKEIHKQLERYTALDEEFLMGHAKAADVQLNLHIDDRN